MLRARQSGDGAKPGPVRAQARRSSWIRRPRRRETPPARSANGKVLKQELRALFIQDPVETSAV